jgi:ribonuclease BN (tRNA processing enzyme)
MSYHDIDAIYVTHLHADHVGGLEYMAFCTYFDPSCEKKVELYGNYSLLQDLWNNTLVGGLASIQVKQMHLEDYFDVHPIFPNGSISWEGVELEIVQSVHIMNKFSIVSSYGLMVHDPDTDLCIFYTGDTQFNPNQIRDFYKHADVIIQDCETTPYKSGVHANFLDLITLEEDIKKKMMLVHYQANVFNKDEEETARWNESAKGAGFTSWDGENFGFIPKGTVIDVRELARNKAKELVTID